MWWGEGRCWSTRFECWVLRFVGLGFDCFFLLSIGSTGKWVGLKVQLTITVSMAGKMSSCTTYLNGSVVMSVVMRVVTRAVSVVICVLVVMGIVPPIAGDL